MQVAIEGESEMPPNVPAPRANHSATCVDNSIVLFGGHGGVGFQRRPCGPHTSKDLRPNVFAPLHSSSLENSPHSKTYNKNDLSTRNTQK